jgi:hypothetical protein
MLALFDGADFLVTYDADDGKGALSWLQSGDQTRIDDVSVEGDVLGAKSYLLGGPDGDSSCIWSMNRSRMDARALCEPVHPPFLTEPYLGLLTADAEVSHREYRVIQGERAACYSVSNAIARNSGEVCFTVDGVPLRIRNRSDRFELTLEARELNHPDRPDFQPIVPRDRWEELKGVDISWAELHVPANPLIDEFRAMR